MPSAETFLTAIVLIVIVLFAVWLSAKYLHRFEWGVVAMWVVLAFAAQVALHQLTSVTLRDAIESDGSNGFFSVSQQHRSWDLLTNFHDLVRSFPVHAAGNLPGKTLLFNAFSHITTSTEAQGYLIMLIADGGSVLVYLLARYWFGAPLTALYALVLCLFLPAEQYFFPLLNTVSPVPLLLVLWLATRYLTSKRPIDAVLAGFALYGLVFFEPLPAVALPILAAPIATHLAGGALTKRDLVVGMGWGATAFAVAFVSLAALGFNLSSGLAYAMSEARRFNVSAERPYSIWVVHNLKDFFLNMGLAQSLVLVAWAGFAFQRLVRRPEEAVKRQDVLLTVAFFVILFGLDLSGINRGETVRLWIFLGVLMQMFVAHACATWGRFRLFAPVVALSLLQTAICLTAVRWVIPY